MKKFLGLLLGFIMCASICVTTMGCGINSPDNSDGTNTENPDDGGNEGGGSNEDDVSGNDQLIVGEGYTKITLDDKKGVNVFGTSVEFDPHFLSQNVAKGVVEAEDWEIIETRVAKMGIDRFRVMLLPSWLEPLNDDTNTNSINWDALTKESAEMQSVYKVLDLAEENDIDVNVTLWGVENNVSLLDSVMNDRVAAGGGHFLAKGNASTNWVMGTNYPEEFAENFSAYIQLFQQKGYTCIKEITPVNEPCWSYLVNDSVSFNNYRDLCLALDARFKTDGIRDDVLFNLSDNTDGRRYWLENTVSELDSVADIYNSHTYLFGYESTNTEISAWEEENMNVTRNTGKPHMIGEFGSNQTSGSSRQSDIDSYERGVLLVRQMLNYYNAGAAGASYWVLFDEYYNYTDAYSSMMMLGLWKSSKAAYVSDPNYQKTIKEDYEVRPQYYAFSMFSRLVPKGAEIYPIYLNDDYAVSTAFKDTEGKWTYVFANGNRNGAPMKLALQNGNVYGSFQKYVYEENGLPAGDGMITAEETVKVQNQVLSFDLAPNSVVIFKDI